MEISEERKLFLKEELKEYEKVPCDQRGLQRTARVDREFHLKSNKEAVETEL